MPLSANRVDLGSLFFFFFFFFINFSIFPPPPLPQVDGVVTKPLRTVVDINPLSAVRQLCVLLSSMLSQDKAFLDPQVRVLYRI